MPTNYNTLPYQQPQGNSGWQWGGDTQRQPGQGMFNPGALTGWGGNYDWSSILSAMSNAFGHPMANDPNMAPNPPAPAAPNMGNPAQRPGMPAAPTGAPASPISRQPGPTALNPGMPTGAPQQPQNPSNPQAPSPFGPFPGVNYGAPQGFNTQSNPFQPKPYNWNLY